MTWIINNYKNEEKNKNSVEKREILNYRIRKEKSFTNFKFTTTNTEKWI